jgi:hypothetical protein
MAFQMPANMRIEYNAANQASERTAPSRNRLNKPCLRFVGNSTTHTKMRAGEPLTYGVFQPLGVTLPVNDCATILPSRTTNVSVPISYTLSTVSALHRM